MSSLEIVGWIGTILTVSQMAFLARLYYKTGWCFAAASAIVWMYWAYHLAHWSVLTLQVLLLFIAIVGLITRVRFELNGFTRTDQ